MTPEQYADIVNVYGSRLRDIAPEAQIVACGQKRSNDMVWSEKVIDLAGENFDVLGVHNYEYEPENFETGLRRIGDYLSSCATTSALRRTRTSRSACSSGTSHAPTTGALDSTRPAA